MACLRCLHSGHFEASKPSANLVKLWENMRAGSYFSGMRTIADAVNEAKGGPGASGENATDNDRSFTAKQINGIVNALLFPVWRMSCAYNGCKQVEEFELRGAHGQDPLMLTKPNESGGIGAATGYLAFLGAEMKRWKAGEPQYSGERDMCSTPVSVLPLLHVIPFLQRPQYRFPGACERASAKRAQGRETDQNRSRPEQVVRTQGRTSGWL